MASFQGCTEADPGETVKKHPEADSLYVESIDIGEAEPRTVCSGLVKYMTEDEIRGATIIVIVCFPQHFLSDKRREEGKMEVKLIRL